jgi:hypothetical protein
MPSHKVEVHLREVRYEDMPEAQRRDRTGGSVGATAARTQPWESGAEPPMSHPLQPITLVPQRVSPARLEAWRLFWAKLLAPHNTEAPVGDTEASKNCKPGFADQAAATASIPTRQRRKS